MAKMASISKDDRKATRRKVRKAMLDAAKNYEAFRFQSLKATVSRLKPFRHSWLNNCPIRQENDEVHFSQWTFGCVRETYEPKREGSCSKLLRFQCSDLDVIKAHHKVRSDLGRLLFGYGIGRILFIGLKDVFQRTAVLRRSSISKQLYRHCGN
jgi:hypothetical protein